MPRRSSTLATLAIVPGAACCAATLAISSGLPGVAARPAVQWAPWAIGLLVLGIPHGAMDHRVGGGAGATGVSGRFLAGYLGLTGLVLIAWWLAPMAALVGFLLVAAFHFGQGDLYWSRAIREGTGPGGGLSGGRWGAWPSWRSGLRVAVRGLVPVALPALAFDGLFAEAANGMAGRLFGSSSRWELSPAMRWSGLAAIGGLVLVDLASLAAEAARRPDRRALAALEAGGTALLVGLFSTVPPVLAMGVYFNAWHSVRHVARLLPVAGPTREAARAGRWAEAMARFQLATMPTTLAALAMMGALWWALRDRAEASTDLGLAGLAMVAALTLPHVLVVLGMDRAQAVWGRRAVPAGEVRP
jgi:Brp/Blh family beta-carotene 15,15'-monooxygenase